MSEFEKGWWQALAAFEEVAMQLAKDDSVESRSAAAAILHARDVLVARQGGFPAESHMNRPLEPLRRLGWRFPAIMLAACTVGLTVGLVLESAQRGGL